MLRSIAHRLTPPKSIEDRLERGVWPPVVRGYDGYAFCMARAADNARELGYQRMTVCELGVAGGNGLLACEYLAECLQTETGVASQMYGFTLPSGIPAPSSVYDEPFKRKAGFYATDVTALTARLRRTQLVLGDVVDTCQDFRPMDDAPISCLLFDLDYYTSTKAAFSLFDIPAHLRLPRILCYFNDVGHEHVGVLKAVAEFNGSHQNQKISWRHNVPYIQPWRDKIYDFYDFEHPDYAKPIHADDRQRSLKP